jgi:hypothetical protein
MNYPFLNTTPFPSSAQQDELRPQSIRGRRPNIPTLVLRALVCTNKKGPTKSPKLEYLRAFMIRFTKKLVRLTILNKKSKPLENRFGRNKELLRRAIETIQSSQGLIESEQFWSTTNDPARRTTFCSFKGDYCKEFFSNKLASEIHDLIVHSLLDKPDPDNLKQFMKIEVRDKSQENAALCSFKDLLLSSQFKGIDSDNYKQLTPCKQTPAVMAAEEIIEHFRYDIDPLTTKSFIKETPRLFAGELSPSAAV